MNLQAKYSQLTVRNDVNFSMTILWSTANVFRSTCIVHADFYSRAYVHRPPKWICKQSYANLLYGMMQNLVRVKVKLTLATMRRTPSIFTRSKCPCCSCYRKVNNHSIDFYTSMIKREEQSVKAQKSYPWDRINNQNWDQ